MIKPPVEHHDNMLPEDNGDLLSTQSPHTGRNVRLEESSKVILIYNTLINNYNRLMSYIIIRFHATIIKQLSTDMKMTRLMSTMMERK